MRVRVGVRLFWLGIVIFLLMSALAGRLFDLQVLRGEEYARMAYRQRTLSLPLTNHRGLLLDRNGVPLTDPQSGWGVAVFPPLLRSPADAAAALAPLAGLSTGAMLGRLKPAGDPYWLTAGRLTPGSLTEAKAAEIEKAGLPGIAVGPAGDRYGQSALARQLVGYINADGGQSGLEAAFNRELTGQRAPALVALLSGTGIPLSGQSIRTVVPATGKEPYSLQTTIDYRVQQAAEEALSSQGPGLKAAAVVMDPHTGEVLAMASRPQFSYGDLEQLGPAALGDALRNRTVTAYPPGSVMKPLVLAEALETGKAELNDTFDCTGSVTIGGLRFQDFEGEPVHGTITLKEAVAQSCNVTFLKLGQERLGISGLREAAARFGFGSSTDLLGPGRDLPEEQVGHVPATAAEGALQIAFGQGGLEATPLQMARAYAAIANDGVMPPVRLVKAIKDPAGKVMDRPPAGQSKRVMSGVTATEVQRALRAVTDPEGDGTGKSAWIAAGGSAGKTGTADGAPGHTYAWFAGYLPLNDPRFVVVVMVEGGGGNHNTGGLVAAPIFKSIGRGLLAIPGY